MQMWILAGQESRNLYQHLHKEMWLGLGLAKAFWKPLIVYRQ